MTSTPRVGCVKYRNARPLIFGWDGAVELDDPAVLCRRLAAGELDVALVSSFEFLRNPIYRIVDGVSIASDGPVYSVIVAHSGERSAIAEIELDPASFTSVALLRCLLAESEFAPKLTANATLSGASAAKLLIGDQAIRYRSEHPDQRFWDLGQEWRSRTGLPFVYALWLIRPNVAEAAELATRLRQVRDDNIRDVDRLLTEDNETQRNFLRRYYAEHLRFNLGEREKQGLLAFAQACANQGLIPTADLTLDLV